MYNININLKHKKEIYKYAQGLYFNFSYSHVIWTISDTLGYNVSLVCQEILRELAIIPDGKFLIISPW